MFVLERFIISSLLTAVLQKDLNYVCELTLSTHFEWKHGRKLIFWTGSINQSNSKCNRLSFFILSLIFLHISTYRNIHNFTQATLSVFVFAHTATMKTDEVFWGMRTLNTHVYTHSAHTLSHWLSCIHINYTHTVSPNITLHAVYVCESECVRINKIWWYE